MTPRAPGAGLRMVHVALALGLIAVAVATLVLLIGAGLMLRTPAWYRPLDAAAEDRGVALENRVGSELSRRRDAESVWTLDIREEDANAWLATRLRGWLMHEGVEWPGDAGAVAASFSPGALRVGVEWPAMGGRGVVWTVCGIDRGIAHARRLGVGGLGVPRSWADAWLSDLSSSLGNDGEEVGSLINRALSDEGVTLEGLSIRVDPQREALVEKVELSDDLLRLVLRTRDR